MTDFVTVGEPGNLPDKWEYGCVPYVFEIAKHQLTNDEWCKFLNLQGRDKSLNLKLYHKDMECGILGGIELQGNGFCVKAGWGRKPVVYVNFQSVCRYCNWLSCGDTETGSYDMAAPVPKRLDGARYFIPNDSEWYKAAYWRNGRYAEYPTGDAEPGLDEANYERGDDFAVGPPYYFADVDKFADTPAPCGALQMGGNAWELLEDVSCGRRGDLRNHYRGGSFGYTETGLSKCNRDTAPYDGRCYVFGARVARMQAGWHKMQVPLKYRFLMMLKRTLRKSRHFIVSISARKRRK